MPDCGSSASAMPSSHGRLCIGEPPCSICAQMKGLVMLVAAHKWRRGVAGAVASALLLGAAASAHVRHARPLRLVPDPNLDAALIVDGPTGEVLYARNDDAIRHPASLAKMMTLYVVFDKLRAHKIALDTTFPASAYAASQPRAHLRIRPGET